MKRPLSRLKLPPPIINIEGEVWKDVIINNVPYKYQISNKGRLKYFSRSVERLTKLSENNKIIYQTVTLYGYGEVPDKATSIHRLVANAFIENPENLPEVNHIDCNKKNNVAGNLEWVTRKANSQHALINGLRVFKYGEDNPSARPVFNSQTGIYYDTIKEASNAHNIKYVTICHILTGRIKTNNTNLAFV